MKSMIFLVAIFLLVTACKDPQKSDIHIPTPKTVDYSLSSTALSKEQYYDKVLGALVGSAIGDAMGASTEMWHREAIQLKYGYITGLTPAVRIQSPEGTWENNLPNGATTDDTRWKFLMTHYLEEKDVSPQHFMDYVLNYYRQEIGTLQHDETLKDTDFLDETIEKVDWIKEWARVSLAYQKGSDDYQIALHRFYGGEMSCAGQLYTPMFGLISETPEEAYKLAYGHTLFDIGYAKDISALVSSMTHAALKTTEIDSILSTITFVDPLGFQDSRLVGRIAYNTAESSINKVLELKRQAVLDSSFGNVKAMYIPKGYPRGGKDWALEAMAFEFLEENEKAIPFHAAEIWQILITALKFSEGDFEKCMQFIVNYGRDNDTVAAVAGMILGAKDGFENLPNNLKHQVLSTNNEVLGLDLEEMAAVITALKFPDSN